MRRQCFRSMSAFLLAINLFYLSGVAQTQSPDSLDKEQARKELEVVFAERNDAIQKGDKEKSRKFLSPDCVFKVPGGKTLTMPDVEKLALRDTGRSDPREEYMIEEVEVKNGAALVKVRHKESYKQRFRNGDTGEVAATYKRRETWVKTAEGWRLKLVDNMAYGDATLNGKPVKPKDLFKISNLPLLDDQSHQVNPEDKTVLQDGQAIAFIYRFKDSAVLLQPPVYLNGQEIAHMRRGRYLKLKLAPGSYQLRSEKEPALSITVEAGRIHYFEVKLSPGFPKAHGLLVLDNGVIGSQINLVPHMLNMQPLDADDIKNPSKVISVKK
ncbi:MAG TPA: DUF2846 domain-containing protein [Blastocatellia bacterium]|nr:DUF2846 domain-containing protein [Blastocatellia bacterium]